MGEVWRQWQALAASLPVKALGLAAWLLAMALGQSVFSLPLAVPYYYISRAFHRRRSQR